MISFHSGRLLSRDVRDLVLERERGQRERVQQHNG